MGIFIKFECDTCGEYECDCPMELRSIPRPFSEPRITNWSKAEPKVTECDIIVSDVIEGKPINQFLVSKIDEEGNIFGFPISADRTEKEIKWEHPNHIKISSVKGEFD